MSPTTNRIAIAAVLGCTALASSSLIAPRAPPERASLVAAKFQAGPGSQPMPSHIRPVSWRNIPWTNLSRASAPAPRTVAGLTEAHVSANRID